MSSGEEAVVEECCYIDLGSIWIIDDYCLSLGGSLVGKEDEVSLLPSKAEIPPRGDKKDGNVPSSLSNRMAGPVGGLARQSSCLLGNPGGWTRCPRTVSSTV
eukprot:Gb_36180 [translate_table: standard]